MRKGYGLFQILCFTAALFMTSIAWGNAPALTPFKFSLLSEPHSLDPAQMRGSAGNYLFPNIYRGLFRYSREQGLIPEGARFCEWKSPLKLICELNPKMKWSDGTEVTARQYITGFRRLVSAKSKTTATEMLLHLKGTTEILEGKALPETLGIEAQGKYRLVFTLAKPDPDFTYKMASPIFAPFRGEKIPDRENASQLIVNGPFQVESWKKGQRLRLKPNPFYFREQQRPPVEIVFVEDDSTNLRLFETGRLNFLRRLASDQIEAFRQHPGFIQLPLARFDYVGFGPELENHLELRKALAHALNYQELKDLYKALGRPGCPSLPKALMDRVPCYDFDLKKAQAALAKVPQELREKRWVLGYSLMGGDDIKKGMEWMQNQWKKHLGLHIDMQPREQGVYLQELALTPPALFRKGMGLDRPTCLAALENFLPQSPENFLRLKDQKYIALVKKLEKTQAANEKKKVCRQAIEHLLSNYRFIPLGEIHFTMLEDQKFTGWTLNDINQLDLTDLKPSSKTP